MSDQPPTPPEQPPGWAAPGGGSPTPPGWGQPPAGSTPPGQGPYPPPTPGQPPFTPGGYGPPPGYGYAPWGYGYAPPQNDKGATTALVLGIVGIVCCGLMGPFAIWEGVKSRRRIRDANGALTGDGMALAGIILGSIAIAWMVIAIGFIMISASVTSTGGTTP